MAMTRLGAGVGVLQKEAACVRFQEEPKGGSEMATVAREVPQEEAIEAAEEERHLAKARRQPKGKEVVLAVLARAAEDQEFLAQLADNPAEALEEYYTLTAEEKAALASGDIKKIESWVGKLDRRLATWLWCRLTQEKW